ncbi:STAS/SEC14 domain-containing protein [Shewanella sp. Isolate11]|uniref:STAS/SEC14 domain-containing protein n=1 Tax=Shewanella sp. Isolate11 TaxID=2908530 RepID=UPI001EFE9E88|nr:STAS/SEC14 domain-containing protein [Shewanella sp. Isolate11]MCG9695749.1 STAS/SEC14 domain-containing protein [Shewanella sp. Isolate11]
MEKLTHGLSIGIERNDNRLFLVLNVSGRLSHSDYQTMTPMLESALEGVEQAEILALVDIRQLEGMSLHAAWDDLKLGIKHGREFKKIAIVGKGEFQHWMTRVGNWFTSGECKFFDDKQKAVSWLA